MGRGKPSFPIFKHQRPFKLTRARVRAHADVDQRFDKSVRMVERMGTPGATCDMDFLVSTIGVPYLKAVVSNKILPLQVCDLLRLHIPSNFLESEFSGPDVAGDRAPPRRSRRPRNEICVLYGSHGCARNRCHLSFPDEPYFAVLVSKFSSG